MKTHNSNGISASDFIKPLGKCLSRSLWSVYNAIAIIPERVSCSVQGRSLQIIKAYTYSIVSCHYQQFSVCHVNRLMLSAHSLWVNLISNNNNSNNNHSRYQLKITSLPGTHPKYYKNCG